MKRNIYVVIDSQGDLWDILGVSFTKKEAENIAENFESEIPEGEYPHYQDIELFTIEDTRKDYLRYIAGALGGAIFGGMIAGPWGAIGGFFLGLFLLTLYKVVKVRLLGNTPDLNPKMVKKG